MSALPTDDGAEVLAMFKEPQTMQDALSALEAATGSDRVDLLTSTAGRVGKIVAAGTITEAQAVEKLLTCCNHNGLISEYGIDYIRETGILVPLRITSGGRQPVTWLTNMVTPKSWADRTPPTPPTVMAIEGTDGALFAKGRISRLYGLSGSAKSWAAQAAAVEMLRAGGSVVYLDADSIYEDFKEHAILLGLTEEDATSGRLHYSRVEGVLNIPEYQQLLDSREWDLVIVDGLNACLSLNTTNGRSGHDAPDVDAFFAGVLHPAANIGAAVVVVDHMRKDGDSDHGSVQKRNNLTGTDYSIKRKVQIAPGVAGYSEIRLTHKDRSGWATSIHAKRGKDMGDAFVYLIVDSTTEGITKVSAALDLPPRLKVSVESQSVEKDADTLLALMNEVEDLPSNSRIRAALKERSKDMDNNRINAAAEHLEGMGLVKRYPGKSGALGLKLLSIFIEDNLA